MRKLCFLLVMFFVSFIAFSQNIEKQNPQSKIDSWYDYYDIGVSQASQNFIPTFLYEGIQYPKVDPDIYDYYGPEKYSQSFKDSVIVDSSKRYIFSTFFFKKQEVKSYSYLFRGIKKQFHVYGEKTILWVELFLFVVLLPILFYCFKYIKHPSFNLYQDEKSEKKTDFEYFSLLFLIVPFFCFFLLSQVFIFLKNNGYEEYLSFASSPVYFFCLSIIILLIGFSGQNKTKYSFPYILLAGCITALIAGIYSKEISIYSVGVALVAGWFIPDFIDGMISGYKNVRKK